MELVCTKTIRMHSNVSLRSVFRVVMSVMISHKTMFGSSLPPVVFMRIHVLIAFNKDNSFHILIYNQYVPVHVHFYRWKGWCWGGRGRGGF
jgi:hypothetical protein